MATLSLLILSLVALHATAIPKEQDLPITRNTIFMDERLEGQIFEDVDAFKDIQLFNDEVNPYRLPTTTRPIHYNVLWHINIQELSYTGTVDIDLAATQADVSEIVIHSDHHTITSYTLQQGTTNIPVTIALESEYQFARFVLASGSLQYNADSPVIYRLTLNFAAPLRDDMAGLYRSWFRNNPSDTEVSWMATTQFQSTSSRFAFPCYDEPSFKATFDITIRRPTGYGSWSATRIMQTVPSTVAGYEDDIYYPTPIMSTYLIAVIVADYGSLPVYNTDGELIHEVIARRGALERGQGDYALDVAQLLLANMSAHTGIDYYDVNVNLKMTQAAIPDFSAGAMENWGLLTYREAYLLYDENNTNGYFKQMIAYILSHEIAHMWFGNLVTCDWWDVLWLNEGFARYYQYFLTHGVEDYMGLDTRFITEQVHTSLLSDSANNPHPLNNPGVGSPRSVRAMFSTLSYNKGAALIRMTEHLLGYDVHEQGLRNYLDTMRFRAALPIDLFTKLQEVAVATGAISEYPSDFSVIDYYKSWTDQPGVPVLTVEVNHQTGDMTITQRRFNINTGYSSVNTNWIVPVTFATASDPDFENTKPTHIIRNTMSIINKGSVGEEWVIFNKQQIGYYRVNYDDHTWHLITTALKGPERTRIHDFNRAQIVNDVFQFARSGIMTYRRALTILSFLENETDYAPWVAAMTGFTWLRNRFAGTEYIERLQDLIAKWARTVMNRITYYPIEGEDFMQKYLRFQLAPVMCSMNVRACRIAATSQYRALRSSGIEIPVDNREFVYCNALREGSVDDFLYLWERFRNHDVYTEKISILRSIGCTPHEDAINTLMDAIINENFIIRPQDNTTALSTVASGNEGNTQIVFNYIKNNLENVSRVYDSIATPLSYVSSRLRTIEEVEEFQGWAWENQLLLGDAFTNVFNGAESSRSSILYAQEIASDLENYLVNGDEEFEVVTDAPDIPTQGITTQQPVLIEPSTPSITGSAAAYSLSMFLLTLGVLVAVKL